MAKASASGHPNYAAPPMGNPEYAKDVSAASAKQYSAIQDAGDKARDSIAKYQQIGKLLEGVDGGSLSPAGLEIAKNAKSVLGLDIDQKMANREAAAAISNQLAMALRDPSQGGGLPGSMSDNDLKFLVSAVPGLTQSAAGRKQMIDMHVAIQQRNADVASKARQWQQRFGRIDAPDSKGVTFQDYRDQWVKRNPLFGAPGQ
jgi:hypothetical protein